MVNATQSKTRKRKVGKRIMNIYIYTFERKPIKMKKKWQK